MYYFYIREIIKINVLNGFGESLDGWGQQSEGHWLIDKGKSQGERRRGLNPGLNPGIVKEAMGTGKNRNDFVTHWTKVRDPILHSSDNC